MVEIPREHSRHHATNFKIPTMTDEPRLMIDAMNVIGSRPNGWWRDRQGAFRKLVAHLVESDGEFGEVIIVMDGRERPDPATGPAGGRVCVAYAGKGGPDAADDRIVELLEADPDPTRWTVITSDRGLRERCQNLGAEVAGAGWLLERIESRT